MDIINIIDYISDNLDTLSNKQKVIGKYLINNKDRICFMSLKQLSEEINVSEVTILNFCKTIGVESFTEMKKQFQDIIKKELYIPKEIKSSLMELDSLDDAFQNTIQIQKRNYERIIKMNDLDTLKEVAKIIGNAKTIYICGQGLGRILVDYLNIRLSLINIDSRVLEIGDIKAASVDIARVKEGDLFILISFPKYSHNVVSLAEYLKENNLSFISITDSLKSPISKNAEMVLKCDSDSLIFHNFISSAMALIELLLIVLCFNIKDKLIVHLDNLENIRSSLIRNITSE